MRSQTTADRSEGRPGGDRLVDGGGQTTACERSGCIVESSPVEAFSLLANEDRLAILDAVARAHDRGDAPVSFSTLRETVGVRDSGRFSYHLQELTGRFLARSSDGYSLHEQSCAPLVQVVASAEA